LPKILQQSLTFPVAPAALYEMYLDPETHAAFTGGGPVRIAAVPGTKWSAFDGRIHGVMLTLAPGRQIVQSWRSFEWHEADLDSILILTFWPQADGTRLEVIHANVPDRLYDTLLAGWPQRYWQPWEAYLRFRSEAT
jgi:activator of HSP90 ATPase